MKHPLLLLIGLVLMVLGPAARGDGNRPPAQSGEQKVAADLLQQMNSLRQARGLPPLRLNEILSKAARTHSADMARYNFFDHTSPVSGHRKVADRVIAAGYTSRTVAENLFVAEGMTYEDVGPLCFQTWAGSPGHLQNMLDTIRLEVGIGVAKSSAGETYVTAVFGRP